jgi:hypothetical protein
MTMPYFISSEGQLSNLEFSYANTFRTTATTMHALLLTITEYKYNSYVKVCHIVHT